MATFREMVDENGNPSSSSGVGVWMDETGNITTQNPNINRDNEVRVPEDRLPPDHAPAHAGVHKADSVSSKVESDETKLEAAKLIEATKTIEAELRREGLYDKAKEFLHKGQEDGKLGPSAMHALLTFEQQHGLDGSGGQHDVERIREMRESGEVSKSMAAALKTIEAELRRVGIYDDIQENGGMAASLKTLEEAMRREGVKFPSSDVTAHEATNASPGRSKKHGPKTRTE